jgi:hypothetical protein
MGDPRLREAKQERPMSFRFQGKSQAGEIKMLTDGFSPISRAHGVDSGDGFFMPCRPATARGG